MGPPEPEETKLTAMPDQPSTPEICDRPVVIPSLPALLPIRKPASSQVQCLRSQGFQFTSKIAVLGVYL